MAIACRYRQILDLMAYEWYLVYTEMDHPVPAPFAEHPVKQAIVEAVANGKTIRKLEKEPNMPGRVTVFRWQLADRDFDEAITRAQRCAGAAFADEVIDIARETINKDKDTAMCNRVAIDALKWAASKYYPKMFGSQDGPRTSVNVAGDVKVVITQEQRQAMIQARAELLGDAQSQATASDDGMSEAEIVNGLSTTEDVPSETLD